MVIGGVETSLSDVTAVVSAFIAVAALVLSIWSSNRQTRLAREVAQREAQISVEQMRLARDSDIIRWADECLDVLAQATVMIESGRVTAPEAEREAWGLIARLSALIDIGRMYFPNNFAVARGHENPRAYRGARQDILSFLVIAHDVFKSALNGDTQRPSDPARLRKPALTVTMLPDFRGVTPTDAVAHLIGLRRHFVSEVQIAIDPGRIVEFMEMAARHDAAKAPSISKR